MSHSLSARSELTGKKMFYFTYHIFKHKIHCDVDDTGYPHDGHADNAAYRHDRRADKQRYQHDREIEKKKIRNGYILR